MKNSEPSRKVILWAVKFQQRDIAEAVGLYGYAPLKPLIDILMELK